MTTPRVVRFERTYNCRHDYQIAGRAHFPAGFPPSVVRVSIDRRRVLSYDEEIREQAGTAVAVAATATDPDTAGSPEKTVVPGTRSGASGRQSPGGPGRIRIGRGIAGNCVNGQRA